MPREGCGRETEGLVQTFLRSAVIVSVNEFLARNGLSPVTDANVKPNPSGWLDKSLLNAAHRYKPGPNTVKMGEDNLDDESDAGIADEIDTDSIVRHEDAIQYIFSGMDNVVLIQASCRGGAPDLIWEADLYDAEEDGTLTFHPQAKQPIPRERNWINYYWSLTSKACSL